MRILLNGALSRRVHGQLVERFGARVDVHELTGDESADELETLFGTADVLITMGYDGGFPPAPRLRLVQLPISGLDQVDLDAVPPAAALCNVYEHEIGIAEYVFAGMLHWVVGLDDHHRRFKAGDWSAGPRLSGPTRPELAGQTLLLIGYGHIGQATACRALAFDMNVLAVTLNPRPVDPGIAEVAGYDDLARLLPQADFVVVCCPLSERTRGLIGAAELESMKDTAVLMNVARGPIADEDALFTALQQRTIAGAVLDTWYQYADPERPDVRPSRHPFHELDNVVMTPHLSGWTTEQQERRWTKVIANVAAVLDGGTLINVIRPAAPS